MRESINNLVNKFFNGSSNLLETLIPELELFSVGYFYIIEDEFKENLLVSSKGVRISGLGGCGF